MNEIIKEIQKDLKRYDKPEFKINAQQFFKEKLARPYVIKTSIVRKVSASNFKKVKDLPKKKIFEICEFFLESNGDGEKAIAFDWSTRCQNEYTKSDFARFERWLKKYVGGWGSCDSLCCGAFGILLYQFPELIQKTAKWRRSKSRWLRRASAVILIPSLSRRKQLKTAFEIADTLLLDEDDMVQKGYGWMLKVAADQFPDDVFKYVMKNKKTMPRTALRYAIEKYPAEMRQKAMKKD